MSSDFIENLVVQTQNGNADAFGELYSVYAKDMYRFALYYTGSPFLAEDAVSDAALAAFRNIGRLKKKSAFRPWLQSFSTAAKSSKRKKRSRSKKRSFPLPMTFRKAQTGRLKSLPLKRLLPRLRKMKGKSFFSLSLQATQAKRLEKCFQ